MKRWRTSVVAALTIVAAVGASAWAAAPKVGEKVDLKFTAVDGKEVDVADFKGKFVIIDFWATWCGPCMQEAPHMVKINKEYGEKGLQVIGISLDQNKAAMLKVAKKNGFTWPQYFDGQVWKNKLAVDWGIQGIPATFLVGPDGTLLWTGHPAMLDRPLKKAFKDHPPTK